MTEKIITTEVVMEEVKKLPLHERKRLLHLLIDTLPDQTYDHEEKIYDASEFEGAGSDTWEGIDATQFVNEMRDEWDKPRED